MEFDLIAIVSLCIILPAVTGFIRFRKISETFYPFIYCIWLGLLNEVTSAILAKTIHTTIANNNIYMLLESLLLLWQFEKWKLFDSNKMWFKLFILLFVTGWIFETFIYSNILTFDSYFSIVYSTIITFMSISMINLLIVRERRNLLKNAIFIICVSFVMYYLYNVLSESFLLYGIKESRAFWANVYYISVVTNFISIILFTLAILWMPTKHRFTLPSS